MRKALKGTDFMADFIVCTYMSGDKGRGAVHIAMQETPGDECMRRPDSKKAIQGILFLNYVCPNYVPRIYMNSLSRSFSDIEMV